MSAITNKQNLCSAMDVAEYFIWKSAQENKPITNKKLQKLLYYAQSWHLALHNGEPLFKEDIEAWIHGPVVPSIYHEFKKYGFNNITLLVESNPISKSDEVDFLNQVWDVYGGLDAEYLEILTHREEPWQKARENVNLTERSTATITHQSMQAFYSKKMHV